MPPLKDSSKLHVIKFGAHWCGPCAAMDKAKTMEKLAAAHPELAVESLDLVYDSDGNEVEGAAANKRAEKYDIQAFPTLVVTDAVGKELARDEGAMNLAGLEKLLARAQKKQKALR